MFRLAMVLGLAGFCSALAGCGTHVSAFNSTASAEGDIIAEGTIYSVKYDLGDGKLGGFTRLDIPQAVPGGNGSWNVDARGKLTSKFLVITYPPQRNLGPHVIPVERLCEVQFGDGGIVQVSPQPSGEHESHEHH